MTHYSGLAVSKVSDEGPLSGTAIDRQGVIVGLLLIRRRCRKCASAADMTEIRTRTPLHQSGHCDLPVGDCDFGHGCHASDALDCGPCDDCGSTERARKKRREKRASVTG